MRRCSWGVFGYGRELRGILLWGCGWGWVEWVGVVFRKKGEDVGFVCLTRLSCDVDVKLENIFFRGLRCGLERWNICKRGFGRFGGDGRGAWGRNGICVFGGVVRGGCERGVMGGWVGGWVEVWLWGVVVSRGGKKMLKMLRSVSLVFCGLDRRDGERSMGLKMVFFLWLGRRIERPSSVRVADEGTGPPDFRRLHNQAIRQRGIVSRPQRIGNLRGAKDGHVSGSDRRLPGIVDIKHRGSGWKWL